MNTYLREFKNVQDTTHGALQRWERVSGFFEGGERDKGRSFGIVDYWHRFVDKTGNNGNGI